uniref:F-box domain-containing protein n=1 Tax=Rhabditophanes sp. KR3021 TaxID=114890 RepID=A0AC35TZU5_9BILA
MVFMGKDWRAPGEAWVRLPHTNNWELIKLRPIQLENSELSTVMSSDRLSRLSSSSNTSLSSGGDDSSSTNLRILSRTSLSMSSEDSSSDLSPLPSEPVDNWIPHCFIKSGNSKEFVGCTSMSEAFYRLDLARAVVDVRRFNFVCKVVQILVTEKLKDLSATSRKHLLAIIQAIVVHCADTDVHVSTARQLVSRFGSCLEEPRHIIGSKEMISDQVNKVEDLMDILEVRPMILSESNEDSVTLLDLPVEMLTMILRKLPDHVSLLEATKSHDMLQAVVDGQDRLWARLAVFHFSELQIEKHFKPSISYRKLFYELKKFYGLRNTYANIICLCTHCKALFWKDHGHPCLSEDAPSVRVTPQQFVDMLLFL